MSDASAVRFRESPPRPACGPVLHRAIGGGRTILVEEFRFFAAKVAALAESRFTTIGIVSAAPEEGRTTVALGLAAALARRSSHPVLLLEADLRQPNLEKLLGLPVLNGVAEWLTGDSSPIPVRQISPAGFSVLTAGTKRHAEPGQLGSERMGALLGACQLSFGFVIVDCPPLSPVADVVELQDSLDGFLLVVRARTVPGELILEAAARLKEGRIQGVVFNDYSRVLNGAKRRYRRYGRVPRS